MAELSVEISAKIDKLEKQLAKAKGEFKSLENSAAKTNSKLGKSSASASKGINKLGKSAINGSSAMTAFSRTVQDAPFGIMGVSNNITNLTEQFGYLKNKTGSAGGALKAMLRDLKGFGGITLVISLVTSALLMFGDGLFKAKDKAKELKEEQEKLTKALKDYEDQLDEVNKSRLIGGRAAASELTSLTLLRNQTLNTTRALDHRNKALKELQKLYPSYFKHLSTDIKDQRELGFAFEKLESKIKDHNKAKAAQGLMSKNQRALTILEIRREEELAKLRKIDPKDSSARTLASEAFEKTLKEVNKLLEENVRLSKIVRNAGGVVPLDFSVEDDTVIRNKVKALELPIQQGLVGLKDLLSKNTLEIIPSVKAHNIISDEDMQILQDKLSMITSITQIASNSIGQSFNQMTSGIKNNLTEQLGAMGSFLGIFVDFLSQMLQAQLQQFITEKALSAKSLAIDSAFTAKKVALDKVKATSNAIVAASNTAAASGPGSAFLLPLLIGGAIAAIGSAFKGAGGVSSNTSTFSPSGGGSFSGSSGGGLQNVVFEIQGTKLVGVLSNTLARNRNLGGSLSLT